MENEKMTFKIIVNTDRILANDWPTDLPAPAVGDEVMWRLFNETIFFTVTKRDWQIGTDPRTGKPLTILAITGKTL